MTDQQTATTGAAGPPPDTHDVLTVGDRLWERGEVAVRTLRGNRVAQAALLMIALHLAYRTWITAASWFAGDDFTFMSRMWTDGASVGTAFKPHGGHLMPAGMFLTWLTSEIAPYDWFWPAAIMLGLQVVADIGILVLLVRMFGLRPGILPPLALYLFTVFSTPMAVWWAAGINQIPFQVVLFWSLASHVAYLRTSRLRHLAATTAWIVAGLAFYEKTVLVLGAIGIVSLAYFASGSLWRRIATMWRAYRPAVLVLVPLGGAYVVAYVLVGLNFGAAGGGTGLLGNVIWNMVLETYLVGLVGGPLRWNELAQSGLSDPSVVLVVGSAVAVALVVRAIHRARLRSLRAWWLPVFFLGCDTALVLSGRATLVGDFIALEYRYQSELAAVTAIALACATLPMIGAVEIVETRRPSRLLDRPRRVAVLTTIMAVLGTVSATQFALHWSQQNEAEAYLENLLPTIENADYPVPLIDTIVPNSVIWGILFPLNLQSNVLTPYATDVDFRTQAVDRLMIVGPDGRVGPAAFPPVRSAKPGPRRHCGYVIDQDPRDIELDGPLMDGGWWVRVGFLASEATTIRVSAGTADHAVDVPAGVHSIMVAAEGGFDEITLSATNPQATVCTDDVTVGRPEAVPVSPDPGA